MDKKILVVYYTRTNNSAKIAETIHRELGGDVEKLRDGVDRNGIFGLARTALQGMRGAEVDICSSNHDPKEYETVVMITPTWMMKVSSPIRTYINRNKDKFNNVAFVSTQGGNHKSNVLKEMSELTGKKPLNECLIQGKEMKSEAWMNIIKDFCSKLK